MGVGIGEDDVAAALLTSGSDVRYVYPNAAGSVSTPVTVSSQHGSAYYLDTPSTPLGLGLVGWNQGENLWVARRE